MHFNFLIHFNKDNFVLPKPPEMRHERSHTKVIATIGPATRDRNILEQMFHEGVDVCRINLSHDTHSEHLKTIRFIQELNEELGSQVAILGDLQGPKLRVGDMENDRVDLEDGQEFSFVTDLLGAAPLGLPISDHRYIEADPQEYVWVGTDATFPRKGGEYVLQVTEELREVLYLDEAKLIVVEGTLYPLLTRLKNDGLLSYQWVESKSGPPRKYFKLTADGEQCLKELQATWEELVYAVHQSTKHNPSKDRKSVV